MGQGTQQTDTWKRKTKINKRTNVLKSDLLRKLAHAADVLSLQKYLDRFKREKVL